MTLEQLTLFADPPAAGAGYIRRMVGAGIARRWGRKPPPPENRGHHENSLEAHTEAQESGRLNARETMILEWLRQHGAQTDREIRNGLFGPHADMNMVRPRVTNLRDAGLIEEWGKRRDADTGLPVRLVRIARGGAGA